MAPLDDTTPATRFDSFHVYRTSFKKIGDHEIEVGFLVPKDLKPGKHPLIVKFHGGGLVIGDGLYPDWMARFYVPFTHRNNAIIVCPNYRLIPEHTGADILEDLNDFWTWFNNKNVTTYLSAKHENIELDYDHVLVTGESAGGHMALVSALTQPQGSIKAIMVQYPMTNYLRCEPTDIFFGNPTPKPESLDEHLASIKPGTVISSSVPPARGGISYVLAAYDRYREFFGYDTKLWSIGLIEDATHMPPTWIIHGGADSVVDVKDSEAFVAKWTEREVQGEVKLSVLPGMEHGFDIEYKEDEEEWLKEGLQWLEKRWLS